MNDEEIEVIPILEERLVTSKVKVETGRVRVRTIVDERQEMVRGQLTHGYVEVERVPMNVQIAEPPQVREEGDTTIIPVFEEVLVVEKKLMLIEELHLRKRLTSEEIEQPVTVRSQRAVVEREEQPSQLASRADLDGPPEQQGSPR